VDQEDQEDQVDQVDQEDQVDQTLVDTMQVILEDTKEINKIILFRKL
jgi:hypothetical protein